MTTLIPILSKYFFSVIVLFGGAFFLVLQELNNLRGKCNWGAREEKELSKRVEKVTSDMWKIFFHCITVIIVWGFTEWVQIQELSMWIIVFLNLISIAMFVFLLFKFSELREIHKKTHEFLTTVHINQLDLQNEMEMQSRIDAVQSKKTE